jgi:hypothetical protein
MAMRGSSGPWTAFTTGSSVNSTLDRLTTAALSTFGTFTGTDLINPLPLSLLEFSGSVNRNDALLSWKVSQDQHGYEFMLERSFDGKQFNAIANLNSTGGAGIMHYDYPDRNVFDQSHTEIYYRLICGNDQGQVEAISRTIIIHSPELKKPVHVYPNPFTDLIWVEGNSSTSGTLELRDLYGRVVCSEHFAPGVEKRMHIPGCLEAGVYLLFDEEGFLTKLVKE